MKKRSFRGNLHFLDAGFTAKMGSSHAAGRIDIWTQFEIKGSPIDPKRVRQLVAGRADPATFKFSVDLNRDSAVPTRRQIFVAEWQNTKSLYYPLRLTVSLTQKPTGSPSQLKALGESILANVLATSYSVPAYRIQVELFTIEFDRIAAAENEKLD